MIHVVAMIFVAVRLAGFTCPSTATALVFFFCLLLIFSGSTLALDRSLPTIVWKQTVQLLQGLSPGAGRNDFGRGLEAGSRKAGRKQKEMGWGWLVAGARCVCCVLIEQVGKEWEPFGSWHW